MQENKGRLTSLVAILAVSLLPLVAACWLFVTGHGVPQGRVNQGELIKPLMSLRDLGAPALPVGEGHRARWRVLLLVDPDCGHACASMMEQMQRMRISLGRDATRVELMHLAMPVASPFSRWLSQRGQESAILLVDPQGYLVLAYGLRDQAVRAVQQDLKRLLRASRVG